METKHRPDYCFTVDNCHWLVFTAIGLSLIHGSCLIVTNGAWHIQCAPMIRLQIRDCDNAGIHGLRPTGVRRSDTLEPRQLLLCIDSHS